ncbi:MAG: DMT family transporter [Rhodospirillaceae bacterium]|jgi:drug/metabolite transporter (DMT)-like permease|nr:DMT family transporter [Rhodospirillaceae bacterium]MBT3931934.1 DMT family transporter [Rhodospirillaceae bacterium]MBT4771052.1 DMT family transporter [Rhodospirillaceae bacterium]MBT5357677.1 DMT family transporter [Rhodospirillaceae bacterium]MBT5768891.1 DMT family transporter [Rhodospirillaceae bacterium]
MDTKREILGIAIVVGVSICFAFSNTLAGLSYRSGADPFSVSTVRFVLPSLILIGLLRAAGKPILMPRRDGMIGIGLGIVTAIYAWSLLSAIEVLPVPLAVLIFFLFPLFTSLIVAVFGWERLTRVTVIAGLVAFGGLALALGVTWSGLELIGIVFGLIAAFGLAIVSVVSSRIMRNSDHRQVTLYLVATAAITFAVIALVRGEFLLPQTTTGWWAFAGTNILFAIAMIGFFIGISMIGPVKTTLFSYLEPLATIAAAFMLLGQSLETVQFVGALVVIFALLYAGWAGLRQQRLRLSGTRN